MTSPFVSKKKEVESTTQEKETLLTPTEISTTITGIKNKLKENPSELDSLDKELDDLQFEMEARSEKSKTLQVRYKPYYTDIAIEKKNIDLMKKGLPYEDAEPLSYAVITGTEEKKKSKNNLIKGTAIGAAAVLAVGGVGYALWHAYETSHPGVAGSGGTPQAQYVKGFQATDPLIPPAIDKNPLSPTETASYIGAPTLTMEKDTFFGKVYPTLPTELQNHIVRADLVKQLTDGDLKNDELGQIFVHTEKSGGMFLTYEYKYIGKDGGEVTYLQSPISLTDSQAATIEKAYNSAK